jgi:hypothetical protein
MTSGTSISAILHNNKKVSDNETERVRIGGTGKTTESKTESNNEKIQSPRGPSNPRGTKRQFMNKKIILSAALLLAATTSAIAQGNGLAGINEATSMVTSYFDPGTKLIYAVGTVVGLIGGVKVYGKFSSGDPDTSKTAASWFGACIFLIVAATILRSFFL